MKKHYSYIYRHIRLFLSFGILVFFTLSSLSVLAKSAYSNMSIAFVVPEFVGLTNELADSTIIEKLNQECSRIAPQGIWLEDYEFGQLKPQEARSRCVVLAAGSRYTLISASNPQTKAAAFIVNVDKQGAIPTILNSIEITKTKRVILSFEISKTDVYNVVVKNEGTTQFDMAAMLFFKDRFDTTQIQVAKVDSLKIVNELFIRSKWCGPDVYFIVEEMPSFNHGGLDAAREYVQKNVVFPEEIRSTGIEGKVYVSFVVNRVGSVIYAKVVRGLEVSLDNEALRVVSNMPLWIPGKLRGKPVSVTFTIPVIFE